VESTLGEVDDEALDLLSRMLHFNPSRRCTAEEALSHEYFLKVQPGYQSTFVSKLNTPPFALQQIEEMIQSSISSENSMQILMDLLRKEIANHHTQNRAFNPRKRPLERLDQRDEQDVKRMPKRRKKSLLHHIHNVFS